MSEHPILFTDAEVRAILDGRKTQTRRPITSLRGIGRVTEFGASTTPGYDWCMRDRRLLWNDLATKQLLSRAPYQAGDLLWVRECWRVCSEGNHYPTDEKRLYVSYRAGVQTGHGQQRSRFSVSEDEDLARRAWGKGRSDRWRSSTHMPRWASRLTLRAIDVRPQRVREISEADARAEGVRVLDGATRWLRDPTGRISEDPGWPCSGYRCAFATVWDQINGKRAPWASDPWVWAITFEVTR